MNLTPLYETSPPWMLAHVLAAEDERWLPQYLFAIPNRSLAIIVRDKLGRRVSLRIEALKVLHCRLL